MDQNTKVVLMFGTMILVIALFIISSTFSYNNNLNKLKGALIDNGATPTQLVCAFNVPNAYSERFRLCGEVKPYTTGEHNGIQ